MVKVLCVLYKGGKDAQEQPRLLGTVENQLGLASFMKERSIEFVVTDSKEGPNSDLNKHIVDADIVITTPFHPAYLTAEVLSTAKNLKLCVTAGVGSDHVDLDAANKKRITVAEVSGSNVVSVAEHVIMTMLILVRNYNVGHAQVFRSPDWNVAAIARNAYDIEGKTIGTIGAGRIGLRVLKRLQAFQPAELLYYDYTELPADVAKSVNARRVLDLDEFLAQCDIVTVNAPLHEGTRNLINEDNIRKFKKGAWLVNTARGAICNAEAVAKAVNEGHLAGYGGDVWNMQPAPAEHPWRQMEGPDGNGIGNAMVPHYSGTTLDAQKRYADGTRQIIENFLDGKPQDPVNLIVENGEYASKAYGQRDAAKK